MFIYTLYKTSILPPINLTQKVYFEQNPRIRFLGSGISSLKSQFILMI